jgi:hypothetical protein
MLKRCIEYYIDFVIQLYTFNCEKELEYFAKKLKECLNEKTYSYIIEKVKYIDSIKDCMLKRIYINELKAELIYNDIISKILSKSYISIAEHDLDQYQYSF